MNPLIKIENMSVIYDLDKPSETIALEDINLEIYPEEYVVIFGPSGCGKSTLLYSIAGIEKPTSGKIYIKNKDINVFSPKELAKFIRRNIGFVFQAYNLIPTLSVIENVSLPQIFEGQLKFSRMAAAKKLLQRFGVDAQTNKLPQELSGGQQQRVGIARSLINDPSIILADEPVGNLDSKSAENVLEILFDLNNKDKKTIILVTHEPRYLAFAHRIIYIKDGRLLKITQNPRKIKSILEVAKTQPTLTKEDLISTAGFYPELNETEIKSKILTERILKEYEEEQKRKLEELITKRLSDALETNEFIQELNNPLSSGGAGLEINQARDLAKKINTVLEKTDIIQTRIKQETREPVKAKVEEIRKYLLENYKSPLSLPQIHRLDELIKTRLKNFISKDIFLKGIYLGFFRGGIGLSYKTALAMSSKMEGILNNQQSTINNQ